MAGRWSGLALICCVLIIQQDLATSQSLVLLRDTAGNYYSCEIDNSNMIQNCGAMVSEAAFLSAATEPFVDISAQMCRDTGNTYHLFDDGTSSAQLFRSPLPLSETNSPVQVLETTNTGASSFDICCDNVIYAKDHTIVAQNLNDDPAVPKFTYLLHADAEQRGIQHVEVCCFEDRFEVVFSIDGHGLYSVGMDGRNLIQIVSYDGGQTVTSMDYNCAPGNEHIALGVGMEVRLVNTNSLDPATLPLMYSTIAVWESNDAVLVQVSLGSVPTTIAPITLSVWAAGSSMPSTLTQTANTPSDVSAMLPTATFNAVFLCHDEVDCRLPCPAACPCAQTDNYQECCKGLCLPRNSADGGQYVCRCNNPATLVADGCLASDPNLPAVPTSCPLDLIGAIKCQGGNRATSSSIYALSMYSLTSICPTAYSGKETPMPRGALPFVASSIHSSGYLFKAPTLFHNYKGDRYGLWTARTGVAVDGSGEELVDSLPIIFQENSRDLYADYVTKTAVVGSEDNLRVHVRRPLDMRRIRWRKNGVPLQQYKGKLTIPFEPFTAEDQGIYEAYFQGRIKRDWRVIIRLTAANAACGTDCTDNSGTCSYGGTCVCPPGRAGPLCATVCPKGRFGVIGQCGFSCQEEFGDDCADCENILFCLEDPVGCLCYPGYELPYCTPCRDGYWGLNCANRCEGATCDPYDGST